MQYRVRQLLKSVLRGGCAFVAIVPQVAFAQLKEGGAGIAGAQAATEPSYVAPYFLVALSLGLGLMVVGRPSKRANPDVKEEGPT